MKNPASGDPARGTIGEFASKNAIILVLVGLILVIGIVRPSFLNPENLVNILRIASVRSIIALGVGGILITRGTDLSAGRTVGFAAVIAASLSQRSDYASKLFQDLPQLPLLVPVLAALGVGLLIGLLNGAIVAFLKVPRTRRIDPERKVLVETVNGTRAADGSYAAVLKDLGFEADRGRMVLW